MGATASLLPKLFFGDQKKITNVVGKPVEKKSIQDDARSFYSKASAIKLLIKGEESRKAFRLYLEQCHTDGEVEYLDYYLTVEGVKKNGGDNTNLRRQYMDIIHQYEAKAETSKHPVAVAIANSTHSWKGADTLTDIELFKLMTRSQEDILCILTPNFEAFVASKYYLEWSKNQNKMEKRQSGLNDKAATKKSTSHSKTPKKTPPAPNDMNKGKTPVPPI